MGCISGYNLQNNKCILIQVIQTQTTTQATTNVNVNTNVQTQQINNSGNPNCFQSEGSKCIKCSNRYYPNDDGKCVPVNPLCRDHNDKG